MNWKPIQYPSIPPNTEATEHPRANRNQAVGTETTIAINSMSGGMGKNDDSMNAMMHKAGIA